VGYQRARLAGGPRGEAVADRLIDDAASRLFARFPGRDSTEENLRLLWSYLEKFGRPVAFYTDKASLFCTAEKRRRDEPGGDKDRPRCRRRVSPASQKSVRMTQRGHFYFARPEDISILP
jgi:hypothetical protein